jgi:phage terminase large subunit
VSEVAEQPVWEFPEKFGVLFNPKRFKVFYGGRDGAKSWSIARALLLQGAERPLRIGCFREIQNSIADSVHKLLCDQIQKIPGIAGTGFYKPLKTAITGANGTEFIFSGLSSETKDSLKSYEGIDIAWIEEAHTISESSWDILEPTIRKDGSEIIVSFNPDLDTDYVYRHFVINPPAEAAVVNVNWNDNPWRSKVLDAAREKMLRDDPDKYAHVYGGACKAAVDGAIYFKEVSELRSSGRICNVPYDPLLKVHCIWDLGYDDYMSIVLVQKQASEIRIIGYIEDRLKTYDDYVEELSELKYRWGEDWLPHDGKAKNAQTGKSPQQILKKLGRNCEEENNIIQDIGLENGIKAARLLFPRCYFDKEKAGALVNRLGRYKRNVNERTRTGGKPVHDDQSHGADAFRYLAVIADKLTNDSFEVDWKKPVAYSNRGVV